MSSKRLISPSPGPLKGQPQFWLQLGYTQSSKFIFGYAQATKFKSWLQPILLIIINKYGGIEAKTGIKFIKQGDS
jgi:hypothetical protein